MGSSGIPGASLRGWAEYFPQSLIYGADIDSRILFSADRIKTKQVDQTNPDMIAAMWEWAPTGSVDMMLDDGLHEFHANQTLLANSIKHIKTGGLYIIEDIVITQQNIDSFIAMANDTALPWAMVFLHHPKNLIDNVLLIFEKI